MKAFEYTPPDYDGSTGKLLWIVSDSIGTVEKFIRKIHGHGTIRLMPDFDLSNDGGIDFYLSDIAGNVAEDSRGFIEI